MVCIAHVGTRNVSVDRLTPSELGDTTTFIQEKKVAAGKNRPPPQHPLLWVAAKLGGGYPGHQRALRIIISVWAHQVPDPLHPPHECDKPRIRAFQEQTCHA